MFNEKTLSSAQFIRQKLKPLAISHPSLRVCVKSLNKIEKYLIHNKIMF